MAASDAPKPEPRKAAAMPSIGDHYVLVEKLGEGAFGEVYRARHDLLGQEFAVKLLKPEMSESEDSRGRFLDEARALIAFSHPNVVQVRHVGEANGRLYLVMDLVRGRPLDEVLQEEAPFSEARALHIIKQALSGLEAAHAAGIIHRDIKPSNLLVEKRPDGEDRLKILDFGLSKLAGVEGLKGAHRSVTGTIVGTLAYMSPEQIKGDRDVDARSDIFALGIVLLEMLQGHHPYPGESGIVVAAKLLRDPIPPLDPKRASKVSDATKAALARALERDRDARHASAAAFAQALDGKGPPSDTSKVTTVQEAQRELARVEAQRARAERAAEKKSRSGLVAALVLGVLVAGGGAFFLLGDKGGGGSGRPEQPVAQGSGRGTPEADLPPVGPGPARPGPAQPEPAQPEPAQPEPAQPEPAQPEPAQPEPAQPEPAQPEPAQPEPAQPEPAQPEPAQPEPAQPEPERPAPPPPTPPDPAPPAPAATTTPDEALARGHEALASGQWAAARTAYFAVLPDARASERTHVAALRGAASAWLEEAGQEARSGRIPAALRLLGELEAWIGKRYDEYASREKAVDTQRLQLGFTRMHRGEARVERARWLKLSGNEPEAAQALKGASDDFEFAVQYLHADGANYWELLIRRAEMHRLNNQSKAMLDDLAHTTQTSNNEVPAHMWVAHVRGLRRIVEAYQARNERDKAHEWAQKAWRTSMDAASWKDSEFTREQWLELGRALFLAGTTLPAAEDPTALHGNLRWFVQEATSRPPTAQVPAAVSAARLKTGQAMERLLAGRVAQRAGKAAEARKAYEDALRLATEAAAERAAVAQAGGLLPTRLPFVVQEEALIALGRTEEAGRARAAGLEALRRNPD